VARLYSIENFTIPVVGELRILGHDVVTIQEQGRASEAVADPEVLAWAISEGRTVLTVNRKDFIRLHQRVPAHAGIIVCTADPHFAGQARRIHDVIQACPDLRGQLLHVNRPSK